MGVRCQGDLVMKIWTGVAAAALMVAANGAANAAVLVSNTTGSSSSTSYAGQSFTLGGTNADSFNNITFSFFSGTNAVASGVLSIFSAAVSANPTATATATANLVGRSTGIFNGAYVFDSSVTLVGNTQYFAYANVSQTLTYSSANVLAGGNRYSTTSASSNYSSSTGSDYKFLLSAVPEPASWAMMLGGFALIGGTLRRRRAGISFA